MYDQNQNHPGRQPSFFDRSPKSMMASAALVCAILGIASSCCLYGAFVFGGLAIILGMLSRGSRKKAVGTAKAAILIGTAAVCLSAVISATALITASIQAGGFWNMIDSYTQLFEQTYGIDLM